VRPPGDTIEARRRSLALAPVNESVERSPPETVIEGKWAPWKVTMLVLLFCGAFWSAAFWFATTFFRLFG
jgi:hypothetical protein